MLGAFTKAMLSASLLPLIVSAAQAETPKRGGTLQFAVVAEPPNYDCHAIYVVRLRASRWRHTTRRS